MLSLRLFFIVNESNLKMVYGSFLLMLSSHYRGSKDSSEILVGYFHQFLPTLGIGVITKYLTGREEGARRFGWGRGESLRVAEKTGSSKSVRFRKGRPGDKSGFSRSLFD